MDSFDRRLDIFARNLPAPGSTLERDALHELVREALARTDDYNDQVDQVVDHYRTLQQHGVWQQRRIADLESENHFLRQELSQSPRRQLSPCSLSGPQSCSSRHGSPCGNFKSARKLFSVEGEGSSVRTSSFSRSHCYSPSARTSVPESPAIGTASSSRAIWPSPVERWRSMPGSSGITTPTSNPVMLLSPIPCARSVSPSHGRDHRSAGPFEANVMSPPVQSCAATVRASSVSQAFVRSAVLRIESVERSQAVAPSTVYAAIPRGRSGSRGLRYAVNQSECAVLPATMKTAMPLGMRQPLVQNVEFSAERTSTPAWLQRKPLSVRSAWPHGSTSPHVVHRTLR